MADPIDRRSKNNPKNWSNIIQEGNTIYECKDDSLPLFVRNEVDNDCVKVIKYGKTDSYEIRKRDQKPSLVVQKPYYNAGRKTRKNKSFFNKRRKTNRRKTNRRKTNIRRKY